MKLQTIIVLVFLLPLSGCLSRTPDNTQGALQSGKPLITKTIQITPDESDEYVTALAFHNQRLWIGTEHYVYSWDEGQEADNIVVKRHDDALENSKVNSIHVSGDKILVAGFEGYSCYENENWSRQPIGNTNEIIAVGNELWSATNSGVEVLKQNSGEWKPMDVSSATDYSPTRQMQALGTDGKKVLWVGTLFGVHRFDLGGYFEFMEKLSSGSSGVGAIDNSHFWKRLYGDYQSPMGGMIANESGNSPLIGNNIEKIKYDKVNDRFFFCTKKGISILKNGSWSSFNGTSRHMVSGANGKMNTEERKGNIDIPTSEIYDVFPFNDTLYLATRSGLGIIDEKSGKSTLVTIDDGIPSNEITSFAFNESKKTLYIGTASGIAILEF